MAIINELLKEDLSCDQQVHPFTFPDYTDLKADNEEVGLEYIDWGTKYTYLIKHKDDLVSKFDSYYIHREIGQETPTQFQALLTRRFMIIANTYNQMYKQYELNDIDKISVDDTYTTLTENEVTPDTAVGDNKYLASRVTQTSSKDIKSKTNIELSNDNVDSYRDIDIRFVSEFEKNFNNILYVGTFDSKDY